MGNNKHFTYYLSRLGIGLMRTKRLTELLGVESRYRETLREFALIEKYGLPSNDYLLECHQQSKSQLRQDMWVAITSQFKKNGTFIEIGAADGVTFSNTFMLEKVLNWSGVLVEPSKNWCEALRKNRSADIETRCCSDVSGKFIDFLETKDPLLSTIEKYKESDTHSSERNQGNIYKVETVSLNDIFKQHKLPIEIDYISVDTEGNEFEIFSTFDFATYKFNWATIENAFDVDKSRRIQSLLEFNGYKKVLEEFSQFDDFYVRADYVN